MATHILKLLFKASDDHPGSAIAKITLSDHSVDKSGVPIVGWNAAGSAELDGIIDTLIDELEQIRKSARRKFANQKQRWKARREATRSN